MGKHAVPKRKTNKTTTRKRYGAFKTKTLKKLTDRTSITKCPDCGAARLTHTACPECGKYKGRQVIDKQKKIDKIKTIKA